MSIKTEKLENEVLTNLQNLQNNLNSVIINLGQIHLRERELNNELKKIQLLKEDLEKDFDFGNETINKIIKDLEQKYGEGEIDLVEGTITFTEKQN